MRVKSASPSVGAPNVGDRFWGALAWGGQALPTDPSRGEAEGRAGKAGPFASRCRGGERDEHQRGARGPCRARGRVRRSAVPERVRADAAGGRAGGAVSDGSFGQSGAVAGVVSRRSGIVSDVR